MTLALSEESFPAMLLMRLSDRSVRLFRGYTCLSISVVVQKAEDSSPKEGLSIAGEPDKLC